MDPNGWRPLYTRVDLSMAESGNAATESRALPLFGGRSPSLDELLAALDQRPGAVVVTGVLTADNSDCSIMTQWLSMARGGAFCGRYPLLVVGPVSSSGVRRRSGRGAGGGRLG